ncbi:MAG: energy transducer TonB [Terracidiphilus sp.]|jgi:TonB family protein
MRREFTIALIAFLPAPFVAGQQTIPPTPPSGATAPTSQADPTDVSLPGPYKIGGNVSAPVVIHLVEAQFSDYARQNRICGTNLIGLTVDASGNPQDPHVIKSLEPSLDAKAIEAVSQYRFKPAMKDGTAPVPVEITVEIDFRLYKTPGSPGCSPKYPAAVSAAQGRVIPAVLISHVEPKYTHDARKNRITGTCTLQLTIDAKGIPRNVHVIKGLDPGLDLNAVKAVERWRYKPAIKDDVPVPTDSTVNVEFKLD